MAWFREHLCSVKCALPVGLLQIGDHLLQPRVLALQAQPLLDGSLGAALSGASISVQNAGRQLRPAQLLLLLPAHARAASSSLQSAAASCRRHLKHVF